jgi:poly(3-hydroxybutyrate) depolymerase
MGSGGAAPDAGGGSAENNKGPSAGCGTEPPADGDQTVDVDGTSRDYIIELPANYDKTKPYKLIFAWHYLGGTAKGIASGGYYGMKSRAAGSAIFVSAQGIDNAWPNTGGRDVAFTQVMIDHMLSSYCVDQDHIFSVGFSYGAIMSNTVGCAFGDVFRAIAPMSGSGPRSFGGSTCKGQVAAWLSHGTSDTTVPFSSGEASRDYWKMANHCTDDTMPVGSCVAYQGCDDGYPVHWCEFSGAHMQPSFAPDAIWEFFSQF